MTSTHAIEKDFGASAALGTRVPLTMAIPSAVISERVPKTLTPDAGIVASPPVSVSGGVGKRMTYIGSVTSATSIKPNR